MSCSYGTSVVKCTRDNQKLNAYQFIGYVREESQVSHHVHVLVTYSNIHKRQCARGIREKRERKREGSEGEIRETRSERGGGGHGYGLSYTLLSTLL